MENKIYNNILEILSKLKNNNLDFRWIFISPIGYCLIKTYVQDKGLNIKDCIFDDNVDWFLSQIGFYDWKYNLVNDYAIHNVSPIHTINSMSWEEIEQIVNKIYLQISSQLWNEYKTVVNKLNDALSELLNNIQHHAWTIEKWDEITENIPFNFSASQIYRNDETIHIAIVDSWVWIFSTIRKTNPSIWEDVEKAIKLALKRWVSGASQIKKYYWIHNQWLGLPKTKDIIKNLEWELFIGTRDKLYYFSWKKDKEKIFDLPIKWKGTFLVLLVDYWHLASKIWQKNKNDYNELDSLFVE